MTHNEIKELLPWYAKRTLAEDENNLIARHLRSCPDCERELEDIGMLLSACDHLGAGEPEPSPGLLEKTLSKLSRHKHNQIARKRRQIPLALAASLVVVTVLSMVLAPTQELMEQAPSFSTGGNAYQADLMLEMLTDGQLEVREIIDIMYSAS